jgi:hypothetical protein
MMTPAFCSRELATVTRPPLFSGCSRATTSGDARIERTRASLFPRGIGERLRLAYPLILHGVRGRTRTQGRDHDGGRGHQPEAAGKPVAGRGPH